MQHPNQPHVAPAPKSDRTSISAVLSLVLALATLPGIFCCVGYGTGIIGIVLGAIALVQVKNGEANQTSKILAIAGITVNALAIVGYTIALAVGMATMPDMPADLQDAPSIESSEAPVEAANEPALETTAAEMVSAYESNELAAEKKYEGKVVKITGVVGDIKKDILDKPYVTLGTGKQFEVRQVQCFLADGVDATTLNKGDQVTLTGRVDQLMMNVLVKDCR